MEKSSTAVPSVYRFFDALEYLRHAYDAEKRRNPSFSHRYIAKSLGSRSSSLFREILDRKVKLGPSRILGFSRLFRLGRAEAEYFETLVLYNQAESQDEKGHFLRKLLSASRREKWTPLAAFQLEYFKKWYYAAVRELLGMREFPTARPSGPKASSDDDYRALGEMLDPPISAGEAMEAVNLLLTLGLARKNAQGRIERVDKVVSSGPGGEAGKVIPSIRGNLELALRALDEFPPEDRPFSYLTLSVSPETLGVIGEKLRAMRKEILDLVSADDNVDRLYQLNFQLFPVSKPVKTRKK